MKQFLKLFLRPEDTGSLTLDDPQTTMLHRRLIWTKPFLRVLYADYYRWFKKELEPRRGRLIVELGSGGGFIKKIIPSVITSDILKLPFVDKQFSALSMPFKAGSVDAFVMIDVIHHLKDVKKFFREVRRTLSPGGKLLAIEPANTLWGRFIYQNFHHETFDPSASWFIDQKGPLSAANGALPWIVFVRDRQRFQKEFPTLQILGITPHTPLRYLLSGGLSYKQLLPSWSVPAATTLETLLSPLNAWLGMFYKIKLEKRET